MDLSWYNDKSHSGRWKANRNTPELRLSCFQWMETLRCFSLPRDSVLTLEILQEIHIRDSNDVTFYCITITAPHFSVFTFLQNRISCVCKRLNKCSCCSDLIFLFSPMYIIWIGITFHNLVNWLWWNLGLLTSKSDAHKNNKYYAFVKKSNLEICKSFKLGPSSVYCRSQIKNS